MLEAARGLDPHLNLRVASKERTAAVVNTHKLPTVRTLTGVDDFKAEEVEKLFNLHTRAADALFLDFARVSEAYFGHTLYGNVLMLGAAYQRGLLPLSWENLVEGVKLSVPRGDLAENLKALELGRQTALRTDLFKTFAPKKAGYWETMEDKVALLRKNRPLAGRWIAPAYRKMVDEAARWIDLEDGERARLAQYVYDMVMFGGLSYARRYLTRLWTVYQRDTAERGFAAARAVLENLAKVMAIKDEVYVAHLLTSEEKYRRDRERYRLDPSRGDRAEYLHLNRPRFTFLGRDVEFDWKSRDWQLKLMKHMRFLRWIMPSWHAREKAFRSWYEGVVDGFNHFAEDKTYQSYVEMLRLPESVKGYREIRAPKMDAALKRAAEIQQGLPAAARRADPIKK
jgi:indolepyruvate ferredoxin oxidoreductase